MRNRRNLEITIAGKENQGSRSQRCDPRRSIGFPYELTPGKRTPLDRGIQENTPSNADKAVEALGGGKPLECIKKRKKGYGKYVERKYSNGKENRDIDLKRKKKAR